MTNYECNVIVKQWPEDSSVNEQHSFLHDVKRSMRTDRPRIVLDCVHLREVDDSIIYGLLCCLEEAMKRSGDIKLAAVPPAAAAVLARSGAASLFEAFSTSAEAVHSFNGGDISMSSDCKRSQLAAENAA